MFYVATSRGFLASAEWKTFHQDIRSAQSFPSFAAANNAAKALKLKGKLQHWCVLTPSPWEVLNQEVLNRESLNQESDPSSLAAPSDHYPLPADTFPSSCVTQKQLGILPDRG